MVNSRAKRRYILPTLIIIVIALVVGISFAWFSFRHTETIDINIATISLESNIDIVNDLTNVFVGDRIVNSVTFNKPATAKNCYVRAKLDFYSDSQNLTNAQRSYLLALNYNAFTPTTGTNYKWIPLNGYYYLASTDDSLLELTDTTPYTFAENVDFNGVRGSFYSSEDAPPELKLNVELQAIQASNLPSTQLADVDGYFNETFDGNVFQGYIIEYVGNGGTDTEASTIFRENQTLTPPQEPTRFGFTFEGWYTDSACTEDTRYDFDSIVTSSFTLYANWTAV